MATERETKPDEAQAVILFDGVCNLCNAAVNFIIDRDPAGRIHFAALQSVAGRHMLESHQVGTGNLESVVLIENGVVYTRSDAVLRAARHLAAPWPAAYVLRAVPRPLRDAVYAWVAANRYRWFGRRESCRVPTPELRARFLD